MTVNGVRRGSSPADVRVEYRETVQTKYINASFPKKLSLGFWLSFLGSGLVSCIAGAATRSDYTRLNAGQTAAYALCGTFLLSSFAPLGAFVHYARRDGKRIERVTRFEPEAVQIVVRRDDARQSLSLPVGKVRVRRAVLFDLPVKRPRVAPAPREAP